MNRRGPLMTLGAVAAFAVVLLLANTYIVRPVKPVPSRPAASTAAVPPAPAHALYTGRSTDNLVTIAIAVNGRKAAGFLHFGFHRTAALRGSVNGSQVVLTGQGARLTGAVSAAAAAVFGTVTPVAGQSVPYAAQLSTETVIYAGRSSDNEVTLAVTTRGARATGYVCNGKTVSAWLQGSVSGNRVTLAGKNGASLSGSVSGLAMFGTVTPGAGQTFPFSAELSPARPACIAPTSSSTGWPSWSAGRCSPTGPSRAWSSRARPSSPRRCWISATACSPWAASTSRPPPSPATPPWSARDRPRPLRGALTIPRVRGPAR